MSKLGFRTNGNLLSSHWGRKKTAVSFLAALSVSIMAGCGSVPQTGKYTSFSDATQSVAHSASDTYSRIEQDARMNAVLTAPDERISANSFQLKAENGKSYDLTASLNKVLASLNALEEYSRALQSLAGEDVTTGIDKASQDLGASISGLKINGLSSATLNGLTAIVDEISRMATEKERKKKLQSVMTAAQPGLNQLASEMNQVTGKLKDYISIMKGSYINHANTGRPAYGTWARFQFDQQIATQMFEYDQITASIEAISNAINNFPEVNKQLLDSLNSPQRSQDALSNFIAEAKRLRTFYKSLPTK